MLIIFIAILIHIYATYITHSRIKNNNNFFRKPLYDIVHSNTESLNKYSQYIDLLLLPFILIIFKKYSDGSNKINILYHFVYCFSFIIILRSLALLVTDMPRSDITCNPHNITWYNLLFGHCYDKIFSGHTSFTLLLLLVSYNYKIFDNYEMVFLSIAQMIYAFGIIITRNHYTIDVLLSYYIVIPLYFLINNQNFIDIPR